MPKRFPLGKRLLRAGVSLGLFLGFLGWLVAQETSGREAATSEPRVAASEAVVSADGATPSFCDGSDSILSEQMDVGLPDEFGVAYEDDDTLEMLRVDIQRCIGGIDWVELGPRVSLQAASHTRPNISPPLLV